MSYKKDAKAKKQKNKTVGFAANFKAGWKQKRPVVFFVIAFFALMAMFYVAWMSDYFTLKINPYVSVVNSFFSSGILNLFGQATQANGDLVYSPVFSISVQRGCDGIEAMALFAAAMLAFPIGWKIKLKGLAFGLSLLFALNLVRIVSLFLTGVYARGAFDLMHVEVWQALFIFTAMALWIFFIRQGLNIKNTSN